MPQVNACPEDAEHEAARVDLGQRLEQAREARRFLRREPAREGYTDDPLIVGRRVHDLDGLLSFPGRHKASPPVP